MSEGIKSVVYPVSDLDVGLDPHGHKSGAVVDQHVKDVGGGRLIAAVKDAGGNLIGLLQDA